MILIVTVLNSAGYSQDSTKSKCLEFDFGADVVSRYVWRGQELGQTQADPAAPQFQPYASFNININENNQIQIGAWGSYGFTGRYNENDLSLKYSMTEKSAGTFSLSTNDYYYPYLEIPFSNFKKEGQGAHTIELAFGYNGPEKFPVNFLISNNILNDSIGNKSLYVEVGYGANIADVAVNFFVGAAKGKSSWHGINTDKFELCNVGFSATKNLKITNDYSLPLGISWIMNPHLKKTYLVFKASI
jgi:hypothetical protein